MELAMTKKYTGQCACGAVKFEFDTNPTFVAVCHCLDCKKSVMTSPSLKMRRRTTQTR